MNIPSKTARSVFSDNEQIERIIDSLCRSHGIGRNVLMSKARPDWLCRIRHLGMYATRQTTSLTLRQIGCRFGLTGHRAVVHGLKAVRDRVDTERKYAEAVAQWMEYFKGLASKPPDLLLTELAARDSRLLTTNRRIGVDKSRTQCQRPGNGRNHQERSIGELEASVSPRQD